MLLFFVVIIGIFVFAAMTSTSSSSTPSPSPAQPTPPPVKRFDENDPYDVCCALACLATAMGYYTSDSFCSLLVSIYSDKSESVIYASFSPLISDHKDRSLYRRLFISEDMASLLSILPFTATTNGTVKITVNRCLSQKRTMEKIQEGMNMVDGKPYNCTLKSYHPGNNPTYTFIELFASD